jgi:hypothetical protein
VHEEEGRLPARRACLGGAISRRARGSGSAAVADWFVVACVGETTGERRTPVVAGVVGGGTYVRRFLVGGSDVATPIYLFLTSSTGNPRSGLQDRKMATTSSSLLGHVQC